MRKIDVINPFNLIINDKKIKLIIDGDVYDNQWYLYWGTIQQQIITSGIRNIFIDIQQNVFCSTNFILSLDLTLLKSEIDMIEIGVKDKNNYSIFSAKSINELNEYINRCMIQNNRNKEILQMTVCDLRKIEKINEYIANIIKNMKNLDSCFLDERSENEFKIKFQNILFELMDNSYKYAYEDAQNCYIAFSVQYTNIDNNTWSKYNKIDNKSLAKEVFISPKIVLYFQDFGRGIIDSYIRNYGIKKSSRRPLREITKKAFFYNSNTIMRKDTTNICGLQYIGKILENSHSYLTIYSGNECVGTHFANAEKNLHTAFLISDYGLENHLYGLSYNFFIDIEQEMSNICEKRFDEAVLKSLIHNKKTHINVRDFRNIIETNPYGKISNPNLNGQEIISEDLDCIFVFLGRATSKQSIIYLLKNSIQANTSTLIICDVLDVDMQLIEFSLSDSYSNIFGDKLEHIYIISQTLNVTKFNIKKGRFSIAKFEGFSQFNEKFDYIYKIKYYESFVLLSLQESDSFGKHMITKGTIQWNENYSFSGYINFDILTATPKTFNFLKFNLVRALALLGFPKLVPLDNMVNRLADEINSEYKLNEKDEMLYLGSIYVSGTTYNFNSIDNEKNLHFFNRNKNEDTLSIFISPEKSLNQNPDNTEYKRIGKSYKIIKKEELNKEIYSSTYLNQKEKYNLFDSNYYNPFIFKHTTFYGNHYMLNVNLISMYNDKSSLLFDFVTKLINSSLGHYLTSDGIKDKYFDEFKNSCGIIYISHHFTDKIFEDQIKQNKNIAKYIIGLNHINLFRYEQSLEFSHVYAEYINELKNDFIQRYPNEEIKFIIFDSLINSGRTRKEIKLYLQSLGIKRIIFVSIIDSQEQRYNKSKNNYSFINMPFPKIGSNSSCPICESIENQKGFLRDIISPNLSYKLNKICNCMKCTDLIVSRSYVENFNITEIYSNDILKGDSQYFVCKDILIKKVFTLYLFLSEQIRQLNDFWIFDNFLENKFKELDINSSALIISLFCLDFYNQCYIKLKEKVTAILLNLIGKVTDEYIYALCYIVLTKHRQGTINVLKKIGFEELYISENVELLLLHLFYYPTKDNYVQEQNMKLSIMLNNSIKGNNHKIDAYKQLHCQLINVNGEIHNSPIENVITFKGKNDNHYVKTAISSLELLRNSLTSDTIKFDVLYDNDKYTPERYTELIALIELMLNSETNEYNDVFEYQIKKVFEYAREIHSYLFLPLGIAEKTKFSSTIIYKIKEIVEQFNEDNNRKIVKFLSNYTLPYSNYGATELYYIFNSILVNEIKYCLDNIIKHCSEGSENVEKYIVEESDKQKYEYMGVVGLDLSEEKIIIDIVNGICEENKPRNLKLRYQKEELKHLGITIEKIDSQLSNYSTYFKKQCFVTRITIPNINFIK